MWIMSGLPSEKEVETWKEEENKRRDRKIREDMLREIDLVEKKKHIALYSEGPSMGLYACTLTTMHSDFV